MASAFLTFDEKGVMATKYHTRLLTGGLSVKGVDVVLKWTVGALDGPTTLLLFSCV